MLLPALLQLFCDLTGSSKPSKAAKIQQRLPKSFKTHSKAEDEAKPGTLNEQGQTNKAALQVLIAHYQDAKESKFGWL